ncbi:MAG: hypothetical protein MUF07_09315 [Steroidobacteraceae bacterium]|jgi:hypothetical protein|nr:hypothetical protein [Steroidobacteraceae bacterium]
MEPIEEFLPVFHFRERHSRRIEAPPSRIAAQLRAVDLADSPFIAPLFAIRGLPARLSRAFAGREVAAPAAGTGGAEDALRAGTLGTFFERAFVTLRDDPLRGVVVGAVGAFWRNSGGIVRVAPERFAADRSPGCARLAWMFDFQPLDGGRACLAVTETRIHCNDAAARRAMTLYWLLIRPASGLIRREMLRLLAVRCSDPRSPR